MGEKAESRFIGVLPLRSGEVSNFFDEEILRFAQDDRLFITTFQDDIDYLALSLCSGWRSHCAEPP
jgi:hypothetical protein